MYGYLDGVISIVAGLIVFRNFGAKAGSLGRGFFKSNRQAVFAVRFISAGTVLYGLIRISTQFVG
jgi:hypothetical protein